MMAKGLALANRVTVQVIKYGGRKESKKWERKEVKERNWGKCDRNGRKTDRMSFFDN